MPYAPLHPQAEAWGNLSGKIGNVFIELHNRLVNSQHSEEWLSETIGKDTRVAGENKSNRHMIY